ncbi:LysR family transcriptional regulator [Ruegeria sp. SCPT10]|uniref:LysR family transcriptional regulator n=1 Tax=Ruegeria sp. SCP10 TaxID=3141377 RepID=UPI00333557A7
MNNISIRKMKVIISAVDEGSFTRASTKQSISQPGVTIIVNQVEEQTQCDIFERTGTSRSTKLTEKGHQVVEVFRRIIAEYEYELNRVKEIASSEANEKEILVQHSFASALNGHWLHSLVNTFGNDNIKFTLSERSNIFTKIRDRDACMGIIEGEGSSDFYDYKQIATDRIVAIVPKNNKLIDLGTSISWKEIGKKGIVYSGSSPSTLRRIDGNLQSAGREPKNFLRVNSAELVTKLVEETGLAAVIPALAASDMLRTKGFSSLELKDPEIKIPVGVVTPWGLMHKSGFSSLNSGNVFT